MPRTSPTTNWTSRTSPSTDWNQPRQDPLSFDRTDITFDSTVYTWDRTVLDIITQWNKPRYGLYVEDLTFANVQDLTWADVTWVSWTETNILDTIWT